MMLVVAYTLRRIVSSFMKTVIFSLIRYLNVSADSFYRVLRTPYEKMYKSFYISKRNGGKRMIEAPIDTDLIHIQKQIQHMLEKNTSKYLSKHAFAYKKNKSIVDNAKEHFRNNENKYIIKIDLKDFFNTITLERVLKVLQKGLGISKKASFIIAKLVTKDGHLPQGACTSPIISNMISKRMDRQLCYFVSKCNGVYSRYSDDIFFSFSNEEYASMLLKDDGNKNITICDEISTIIKSNGFVINTNKIKYLTPEKSQNVCGIVINKRINVRRKLIKDIRIQLHKLEQGDKTINVHRLTGKLSFMRFVRGKEDALTNKYCKKLNEVYRSIFPDSDFLFDLDEAFDKYLIRIENADNDIRNAERKYEYGTGFFSNGYLITSKHVVEYEDDKLVGCLKGFFRNLNISYYDNKCGKKELKMTVSRVINAFYYNEIAFLQIDNIDIFKNRELKISSIDKTLIKNVYCCGCQVNDGSSLGVLYETKRVIGFNNYKSIEGLTLQKGSILKGMSGAPALLPNTYEVVGVNFEGHESGDINRFQSVVSILNKNSFKEMRLWKPDTLWSLKNNNWEKQ